MVCLAVWGKPNRFVELDPASGRTKSVGAAVVETVDGAKTSGFVHLRGRRVGAVYSSEGTIFFQWGAARWDLRNPEIKVFWERGPSRLWNRFRVEAAGVVRVSVRYVSRRALPQNWIDGTFDSLDEELQDFFLWLAKSANDPEWIAGVRDTWS